MRKLILILGILILLFVIGERAKLISGVQWDALFKNTAIQLPQTPSDKKTIVYEESVITKVVEDALPSVVTIGISKTTRPATTYQFDPTDPFSQILPRQSKPQKIEQNIGSGFIITADGLIITNKHVVADTAAGYNVLTNDKKSYTVQKIYRDPLNDLAIIKVDATGLKPLKLGDASKLKLGQMTIAIGTPLGEFTNTVTSGIVSGLGRGITAGSPFEGYVEKLDNVIQTDAAISPGNSGGPLLNSSGEVIGINTAVAQEGQNIGFAIPVNIVKDLIITFNKHGGSFERPYIGVRYKMIDRDYAVLNDLVEGAYVLEVLDNSPASKADIQTQDIIMELDGTRIKGNDDQAVAKQISEKKIGDTMQLKLWRDGQTITKTIKLEASP